MASLYSASIAPQLEQRSDAARSTASDGRSTVMQMAVSTVGAVGMARAERATPEEVVSVGRRRPCLVARGHTNSRPGWAALALICSTTWGCSEDAPAAPDDNTGGSTASANGGASNAGDAGSGGQTSQGGSTSANGGSGGGQSEAGSGGSGTGGSAPADDPTTPLSGNFCSGIGNGDPCPMTGTCSDRVCGLADLGTRDCVCDGTWTCTSCAFPMGPDQPSVLIPPGTGDAGALRSCEQGVARDVPCSPMGDRCALADGDVCACWIVEDGMNVWDCDSPPNFWP